MRARALLRHTVVASVLTVVAGLGLVTVTGTSAAAAGTTASAASTATKPKPRVTRSKRAATVALHQLGDPYRWGGTGPGSFDCSGLVRFSYSKAGLRVPRTSRAQAARARHISKKNLRRGDLMFFHSGGRVYHAAIFLRWTKKGPLMVHAPGSGKRVERARPWTGSWFAGTIRR